MVGSWYQNGYITLNSSSEWCVCLKLLLGKNISIRHIYWHQLSSFFSHFPWSVKWSLCRWFMIITNHSLGRSVEAAQGFGGNGDSSEWITIFDHECSLVDFSICGICATLLLLYNSTKIFFALNTGNFVPSLYSIGHLVMSPSLDTGTSSNKMSVHFTVCNDSFSCTWGHVIARIWRWMQRGSL